MLFGQARPAEGISLPSQTCVSVCAPGVAKGTGGQVLWGPSTSTQGAQIFAGPCEWDRTQVQRPVWGP